MVGLRQDADLGSEQNWRVRVLFLWGDKTGCAGLTIFARMCFPRDLEPGWQAVPKRQPGKNGLKQRAVILVTNLRETNDDLCSSVCHKLERVLR